MMRTVFWLVVAALASGLWANDIAASAPDGKSGWLLLENPYGPAGPGLSERAGDPGMPAPDALNWPHSGTADGSYPQTDLWRFADGKYTRATNVLAADASAKYRRTLYAVFTIGGMPYVLHYDPFGKRGITQVLRVDDATANAAGVPAEDSIVLASGEFLDAPAASPDGKHVAFRAFKRVDRAFVITLRVYATADWKLAAESEARTFARPVWINEAALAVIAFDAALLPDAPQRDPKPQFSVLTLESHTPQAGKLLRLDLAAGKLTTTDLFSASFPPDRYTRTVLADPKGLGLLVAREERSVKDGKEFIEIIAEQREPKADGKAHEIARFEVFRGLSVGPLDIHCAGIRTIDRARTFVLVVSDANGAATEEMQLPSVSPEAHGGLIDMGHGVFGLLEPVANPDYEPVPGKLENKQLLRHTLAVPMWRGCDTMCNPRVLQQLSKLVRRFKELGTVKSTLLAFDVEIAGNGGRNQKKGRYVELYSASGRKGNGTIRIEDNLSGSWLVQSIEGAGNRAGDDYYSWSGGALNAPPKMDSKPAIQAGKAYDDLITQLEARKLLMLGDVDTDWSNGGLTFLKRSSYRDPASGATWRTWVFEKFGRVLDEEKYKAAEAELKTLQAALEKAEGDAREQAQRNVLLKLRELKEMRERIEIRFVADLPIGSAGDWAFPHAIAQVQLRFALSNQQKAAVTELTFEPNRWVALPNLLDLGNTGKRRPDLLLPKVFRIYGLQDGKLVEELKAVAVTGAKPDEGFEHSKELVATGKLTPGYDVPKSDVKLYGPGQFTNLKR